VGEKGRGMGKLTLFLVAWQDWAGPTGTGSGGEFPRNNTIKKRRFMKKIAVLGVLLAVLSVSAFALPEVKMSAGGGFFLQDYWTTRENSGISAKYNQFDWGIFGLFDATYVEANLGLAFGTYTYPVSITPFTASTTHLVLSLYGKYPFAVNEKITIFPLLGFDYNVLLSYKYMGGSFSRSDLTYSDYYDAFLISFGVGFDYDIGQSLYFRGEGRWGFRLHTKQEKKDLDTYSGLNIFSTGPKFTAAVGYKF
jgi:hypothetical protein